MRVPYSWLQDYVSEKLPSPTQLADILTLAGLEVDSIERANQLDWVIVAQVVEIKLHPETEHLFVVQVNAGSFGVKQLVTGAQNLKPGLKVPLALPGASLPNGQTIEASRFKGLLSEGMLCSSQELSWEEPEGKETTGILILPRTANPGDSVAQVLQLGDIVLDIEVTPNRSDCLSMIGVAREVATATGAKLVLPQTMVPVPKSNEDEGSLFDITVAAPDLCHRYAGALISNVSLGSSPAWLKQRLMAAGMRPVNNIVDITNYVMLETGQPLHAFDYSKLAQKQIVVRHARPDEVLITLDGTEQKLTEDMLVIADGEKPQALAGIMGGLNSEITTNTDTVLLESASFANINIRRTARSLGMRTEASLRFERGVDPNGVLFALHRTSMLLKELEAGELGSILDVYPEPVTPHVITANPDRMRRLIGASIEDVFIKKALERLQLQVVQESRDTLQVRIPTFRQDLKQEADLVEEVARLYGFDRIPALPLKGKLKIGRRPLELSIELQIKDILRGCGLDEVQTYSFINPKSMAKLKLSPNDNQENLIPLMFPLSEEQSVLRTTLLPSLLEVAAFNLRHKAKAINIFEISRVYLPERMPLTELPSMPRHLAIVLAGTKGEDSWQSKSQENDFYRLKGILETLIHKLGVSGKFVPSALNCYHPGRQATFKMNENEQLASLGELHPDVAESFDLATRVYALELDLSALFMQMELTRKYQPLPRYPSVERDLALTVPQDIEAIVAEEVIREAAGPYLAQLKLFDVYLGEPIPIGYKSLAYSLLFRAPDHTLTEEDINPHIETILQHAAEKLGAFVRH